MYNLRNSSGRFPSRDGSPHGEPLMRHRGPLADSYPAAVALVVFALIPYLGGRRMLLLYATLFVIGSVMTALAFTPGLFIAGHVLQGLTTSLMLIAAVPPLVIGWPTSKMPWTGFIMNLCIFGAVALGPVIGGVQAGAGDWRPLFWVVAGLGALVLVFVLLTYEDQEAQDRSAPWDLVAIALADVGSAAAFFGASELLTHSLLDLIVSLPLVAGVVMIIALIAYEYTLKNPLMPVRQLATTFPVAGVTVAMCAGAASIVLVTLVQTALQGKTSPEHLAMLCWPEFGAAFGAAILFALLFRTRFVPVLAFGGMAVLAGGAAVLSGVAHGPEALVVIGSALVGFGAGSSVSPALFISGFSLRSGRSSACPRSSSCCAVRRIHRRTDIDAPRDDRGLRADGRHQRGHLGLLWDRRRRGFVRRLRRRPRPGAAAAAKPRALGAGRRAGLGLAAAAGGHSRREHGFARGPDWHG
jgi:MFS family permease